MGLEGRLRNHYYAQVDARAPEEFRLGNRNKHPPGNRANALMSFGNGLCYAMVLNEIYKTQLNPTISYLHQPSERRFSLALDISEVFKPFMVDRLIFRLINLKMIQPKHFEQEFEGTFLNEKGRKVFLTAWDERLGETIHHRQLKKQVSYRNLVRLECLKIVKHLLDEKQYTPFRMWW